MERHVLDVLICAYLDLAEIELDDVLIPLDIYSSRRYGYREICLQVGTRETHITEDARYDETEYFE